MLKQVVCPNPECRKPLLREDGRRIAAESCPACGTDLSLSTTASGHPARRTWLLVGLSSGALLALLFAGYCSVERQKSPPLTNSIGMRFVPVPKGTFWMASGEGKPGIQVEIKEDYELGATEVTQGQWRAIMGDNPSFFSRHGEGAEKVKDLSDTDLDLLPVENLDRNMVKSFLEKLNEKEKGRGYLYRLPREAEWEYACRGAATSQEDCSYDFYFAQPTNYCSSEEANCFSCNLSLHGFTAGYDGALPVWPPGVPTGSGPRPADQYRTCKVGSYQPNRLGLYDMHGNVWELCDDNFVGGIYEKIYRERYGGPRLPYGEGCKVIRGGSWASPAESCRAANRGDDGHRMMGLPEPTPSCCQGFRVARTRSGGK